PAIQNAIPIPYYGTNVFAAPGLGIIASIIMLGGGLWWLRSREAAARRQGEGYGQHSDTESAAVATADEERGPMSHMPLFLAVLPLLLVVGVNALFTYVVFPGMDLSFLTERFPSVSPQKMTGLWALIVALVVACATLIVSRLGRWSNL